MSTSDADDFGLSIRHIDEQGMIWYSAREVMLLLGYTHWDRFLTTLVRARKRSLSPDQHFRPVVTYVPTVGRNLIPTTIDYRLTHYALFKVLLYGEQHLPGVRYGRAHFRVHPYREAEEEEKQEE